VGVYSEPGRTAPQAIPARAGIGLRAPHHDQFDTAPDAGPDVAWVEVHSENFFATGGPQHDLLARVRERFPLSLHGVGLSLGSAEPLDPAHVARLQQLIRRSRPALVSEHLCWGRIGGRHSNDLLPLPYTDEALTLLIARVTELQQRLERRILIENVSSYLRFVGETWTEWDFLAELAKASGCGILLDLNNIHVNACNHGFDAVQYLEAIPGDAVGELHLAGFAEQQIDGRCLLIDTHGTPVCDAVWELYAAAIARFGRVPTLIEWDTDIPSLERLCSEAAHADRIAEQQLAHAA